MAISMVQDLFIKILSAELNSSMLKSSDLTKKDAVNVISELYYLAKRHDLAHIVAESLRNHGLLKDDEISEDFKKEEMLSVMRNLRMKHTYNQICEIFNAENIPYIPLKGSVIRPLYPNENMRTSCDIDILVRDADLTAAVNALCKAGYKSGEKTFHEISLYSPGNVHLELHFNILEGRENLDLVLKEAWNHAKVSELSRYDFSDEFFLFYIYAHIANHFLAGGCGIRPLIDIWIIKKKLGISYNDSKELLEKAGIYHFAEQIDTLADICFSGKEGNEFSATVLSYIFDGGTYGNSENNVAMSESEEHLTLKYMFKRIFVPYRDIALEYPFVRKFPPLYIFCWIHRSFKLFFGLVKRLIKRKKTYKSVSDEKKSSVKDMRERLGL